MSSIIQEYTAKWGILVEPKFEFKGDHPTKTNIIGLEAFLQLVDADKLKQNDSYRDKLISRYLIHHFSVSLLQIPGMDNYFEITNLAKELDVFVAGLKPHEETRQAILEQCTVSLEKMRQETDFHDFFNDPEFVKEYKKEGQSIKGARKLLEKYGTKGKNTLFASML